MCLLSYLLDAEILDISTLAEDLDISAWLTPSLPECLMGFCKASLIFESADEILWCDHSNESSLPVLSHGAICLSGSERVKILFILELCSLFQALSEYGWCIGERHAKMYLVWCVFPAPIFSHSLHDLNTGNMLGLGALVIACRHVSVVITPEKSQLYCLINFVIFVLEDRPYYSYETSNPSLWVNVKLRLTLFWYKLLSFSYENHAKKFNS